MPDETVVGAVAFEVILMLVFFGLLLLFGAPVWAAVSLGWIVKEQLVVELNRS